MKKTVIRAIESRQNKLNKRYNLGEIFSLKKTMEELITKGKVNVGGRQQCSATDHSWDFYIAWNQVVNIFNKYEESKITSEYVKIDKPGGAFSGGYWQERIYTLNK